MVEIGEHFKGCDKWGYQPASYNVNTTVLRTAQREALNDRKKADREAIKVIGMRSTNFGYPDQKTAVTVAEDIETRSGVTMHVFSHSYL